MAVSVKASVWDSVLEFTKSSQDQNTDPFLWAIQLSSTLGSAGVALPSVELAHLIVSHICWSNDVPITWKFLEKAVSFRIAPPLLVLALLSARVIPSRRLHPGAYRLYLELLKTHAFLLASQVNGPNYEKIMKSIDDSLHLSQNFSLQSDEPGVLLFQFVFALVCQLLDASLDDEGLLELPSEKKYGSLATSQDMEIDSHNSFINKKMEQHESMHKSNTMIAIELIGKFMQHKITCKIIYLARRNMPLHWTNFIQRFRLLVAKSTCLRHSKHITPEQLLQLASDKRKILSRQCKKSSQQQFHAVMASGSLISSAGQCHGASWSALWISVDLFLEDTMDGSQVKPTSAAETLTGLVKALQAVNGTTWHSTFLGLWIAALRLIQRERDPSESPAPRLETCVCLLLCITTLAIANLIEEEENALIEETKPSSNQWREKETAQKRHNDLITSLQLLGDHEGLLTPPEPLSLIANQAAAKAVMYISGLAGGSFYESMSMNDMPINFSGNMRHLIVEACIARNLLDVSAYLWPGYVSSHSNQVPRSIPGQMPGWSSLIKGSPLTPSMVSTLVSTPASSLAEVEKIYEIAESGTVDDKMSAANILCGATLVRGWNIQEHTVNFIIRLLSPPPPSDYLGSDSHLINCAPLLNVLLVGISSMDCLQIISLNGLAPQLAGGLMPICEVFGSCAPKVPWVLPTGEELSSHAVFSNAFTLLLKLWKFHRPPLEHVMGDVTPVGSQLTPEFLLSLRNSQIISSSSHKVQARNKNLPVVSAHAEPLYMDAFPKLKRWYQQHQACIASTLSGLSQGTPVYQIVESLLGMMFRKVNRGQPLTPANSGSSGSSCSGTEDSSLILKLPAWDILEAVPFVLDSALTACAHGWLSPRDLTTGLKDLADFLPASLVTIVSYFSAEVTRGIWKPAFMNGTDWPSPGANLSMFEEQLKKILATTGVDVPSLGGSSLVTLPLPLAALLSLTITYKVDKASERFMKIIGPALINLAEGCPWPCMAIISSLWAQKVKRWSDYLVFTASRTVFHHSSDAVVQLLKSCFASVLGLNSSPLFSNGGVGALLGHGRISPVAPGIFYLRVHRSIRDVMFMTEEVVSLLMFFVGEISKSGLSKERLEKLKKAKYGTRYGQVSLAAAMSRVKLAASFAASLVHLSGGLNLVQSLIKETLPSWFISNHGSEHGGEGSGGGMVAMLGGYALSYFAVLCGAFAWGVDTASPASKRRSNVLGVHLQFLASALDGKISLGCDPATWRAYVCGFVSLMVGCASTWVLEVDVGVLKSLSKGLRRWDEEELALALLGRRGVAAVGAAAELIVESDP